MKAAILSLTSGLESRGVETVVWELASRWNEWGEVVVYQAGVRQKESYRVRRVDPGFDWQAVKQSSWRRKYMLDEYHAGVRRFTQQVLAKLAGEKIEVVMPMNGGWQSLMVKQFCRRVGAKMIISGQAGLGWNDRWNLLMRPDVFVALTERNARWSRRGAMGVRVEVIPNGVDLVRFKPAGSRLKLGLARPIVLCVAGGDKYKRVEWVMEAVRKWGQGSLLLVGGSHEQEERGKRLLGKRFKRLRVTHDQMPEVYRSVDIFVLMSRTSEAFGIAYLEALASGLPVVAPDDELRREILGRWAVYVRGERVVDLVEGLIEAERRDRVRLDKWLSRFDWDRIAERYWRLLAELKE